MRNPASSRCVQNRRPGVPIGRGGCVGVVEPNARKTAPRPSLMKLFKPVSLLSSGRAASRATNAYAVRAAEIVLTQ